MNYKQEAKFEAKLHRAEKNRAMEAAGGQLASVTGRDPSTAFANVNVNAAGRPPPLPLQYAHPVGTPVTVVSSAALNSLRHFDSNANFDELHPNFDEQHRYSDYSNTNC